ncbi:MAG: glycosyltransferase [Planctomycetota bacterium]
MWVLTSFFALTTLLLAWLCAAYFVVLCFTSFLRRRPIAPLPDAYPTMSVMIACYNEAGLIEEKVRNLAACDYPRDRLEIVFVDGGSSDDTVARLHRAIPTGLPARVVVSPRKGKIHQLNHVLPQLRGEIIVNTDADARMRGDCLKQLAAEFAYDRGAGAVGAFSFATNTIWRDRCFWDSQNRGRLIESDAGSSSIVIATCYAFRRDLLEQFPEDVVADDVYVGFLANSLNQRVIYSRQAIVEEVRGPAHISEFLSHKFRKNNAFLRESLRFLYRLPDMSNFARMMMLTRVGQQLLLPYAVGLWSVLALTLFTMGRFDLLVVAAASLALLVMITNRAFHCVAVPPGTIKRFGLLKQGAVFFDTLAVLFAAALSYPFYRQNSSYSRLGETVPTRLPIAETEISADAPLLTRRMAFVRRPPSPLAAGAIRRNGTIAATGPRV